VVARNVERALAANDETANQPRRLLPSSLWFQFETTLPFSLTSWASEAPSRIDDWHSIWGSYRSHFDPYRR
jgi:hypothetical protein